MRRLIWSTQAQRDLDGITEYFGRFSPDLPLMLIERIERAVLVLLEHPQLGPKVPDSEARVWRARRTPYLIFYRPTRDGVRILKVKHARTDWKPHE